MRGREELTMDGKTRITWVLRPSHEALPTRPQRVTAGISDRHEALRAKLIAATVELAANGSNPRLRQSRDPRTAPWMLGFLDPPRALPMHHAG